MPPDKRGPRPVGGGRGPQKIIAVDNSDKPEDRPRRRRRSTRTPGPAELARARELRRRGLHLKLVEAWRP